MVSGAKQEEGNKINQGHIPPELLPVLIQIRNTLLQHFLSHGTKD